MTSVVKARREGKQTSKYKDLLQLMIDTTGEEELEGEQGGGGGGEGELPAVVFAM